VCSSADSGDTGTKKKSRLVEEKDESEPEGIFLSLE